MLAAACAGRARLPGPAPALAIARGGASAYTIYLAPDAPASVVEAAADLHDYIQRATNASLPVSRAAAPPSSPLIALGQSAALSNAGVSIAALAPDAYRIASRGANLFIAGPDSPSGEKLKTGGTTTGTANGVHAFLERFVNVRWLMPGPDGDDVPKVNELSVPAIDISEAPAFGYRQVPYVQNGDRAVEKWLRRQNIGSSVRLYHGHHWTAIEASEYQQHPDWFAMKNGVRPPPGVLYKLETTNPGLVQAFADRAIAAFRKDPNLYTFSISPADGRGWSDSPESKALYDTNPHGGLSITPLILKFYNDVAAIVGREFPDRRLCGYLYLDYMFPPSHGIPPLAPNLCLVVAPHIDYGYQLFRDQERQDFQNVMAAWGRAVPLTAYYDLPSRIIGQIPAPTPVSADILQLVFDTAAKSGMQGVYVYGVPEWGFGAATNYVEAQLAWNPSQDAHALVTDFFTRAYGPAAGASMQALNGRLEQAFRIFYRAHDEAAYRLTTAMLREIYVPMLPDIERTYEQALSQCTEPSQRARLEMYGRDLILLHWDLRRLALIPDTPSPFARTNGQITGLLKQWNHDLATSPEDRKAAVEALAK